MLSLDCCSATGPETDDPAPQDSCLEYVCSVKRRRQLWAYRYENQIEAERRQ